MSEGGNVAVQADDKVVRQWNHSMFTQWIQANRVSDLRDAAYPLRIQDRSLRDMSGAQSSSPAIWTSPKGEKT